MGRINRTLFGISPKETRFDRRGFEGGDQRIRERIEQIGASFVEGYHAALLDDEPDRLAERLRQFPAELHGFIFEGAGMGLVIADFMSPWRPSRLRQFLQGPGDPHAYMIHVGAGWGLARLPVRLERATQDYDPLLRWLAIDGYGFHQAYFQWRRFVAGREAPKNLSPYGRCAFDQGLGRSLWFVKAGDPDRIAAAIAEFDQPRRTHLWSGVGLACAYAGGVEASALEAVRDLSGGFLPAVQQGVAFAAKTRLRAGNLAGHTELACGIVCGCDTALAAAITDQTLEGLQSEGELPAYEIWRRRIQSAFGG